MSRTSKSGARSKYATGTNEARYNTNGDRFVPASGEKYLDTKEARLDRRPERFVSRNYTSNDTDTTNDDSSDSGRYNVNAGGRNILTRENTGSRSGEELGKVFLRDDIV